MALLSLVTSFFCLFEQTKFQIIFTVKLEKKSVEEAWVKTTTSPQICWRITLQKQAFNYIAEVIIQIKGTNGKGNSRGQLASPD